MKKLLISAFMILSVSGAFAEDTFKVFPVGGKAKLVSLLDMPMSIDSELLYPTSPDILKKYLKTDSCDSSLNVFLFDNGKDIVLIDSGLGKFVEGTKTLANMAKAGYKADDVTAILITHMHGDHIGGLFDNGKPVFKNAKIYLPKTEYAFWSDRKNLAKVPTGSASIFDLAELLTNTYGKKITTFESGKEVMKGVVSIPAYGHTAGHTMYKVSDGNAEMVLWGDIIHCLAVQIKAPETAISYDSERPGAIKTRIAVLKDMAKSKIPVAGAHLPFPGVGVVTESNGEYSFTPLK